MLVLLLLSCLSLSAVQSVKHSPGMIKSLRPIRAVGRLSATEKYYDEEQFNTDIQRITSVTDQVSMAHDKDTPPTNIITETTNTDDQEKANECAFYFYQLEMYTKRIQEIKMNTSKRKIRRRLLKGISKPPKNFNCTKPARKTWRHTPVGKGKRRRKTRHKRLTAIVPNFDITWDLGIIPYNFTSPMIATNPYPNNANGRMRAKNHFQYWTCLRFMQWTPTLHEELGLNHDNYLNHDLTPSSGCSSILGNSASDGQRMLCCWDNACVHEIGHALGQAHEQRNPREEDYLHVNVENLGTANSGSPQFHQREEYWSIDYNMYDMASQMHYNIYDGTYNGKKAFTVNNPDDEYLIVHDDPYDYYLMYQVSTNHKCSDLMCYDFTLQCENGGYQSFIRDKCTCKCPDGLDPATGCTTKYDGDRMEVDEDWPWGSFTLLATSVYNGCPKGFYSGSIIQHSSSSKTLKKPFTSTSASACVLYNQTETGTQDVNYFFCTKRYTSNNGINPSWPNGHYCIYRQNENCPEGFTSGQIDYQDEKPVSLLNGDFPDGIFTSEGTTIYFCCRNDIGISTNDPLNLPSSTSFILFKGERSCHPISGMTVSEEWFTTAQPISSTGSVPYEADKSSKMQYCYYQPESLDRTLSYSLWPADAFAMISTISGCPQGFQSGFLTQTALETSESSPYTLGSELNEDNTTITHHFCTKEETSNITASTAWMPGQYCILSAHGKCPQDFELGSVTFVDASPPSNMSGTLPDGEYTSTTKFNFCCREDGFARNPVVLPTERPFTLFQSYSSGYGRQCQEVKDMISAEEFYTLKTNGSKVVYSGLHPHLSLSWNTYFVHVCAYYPANYSCGGIIHLNSSNPTAIIESPSDDGIKYNTRVTCYWHIFSPENSKILLDFDSFAVLESTDHTCDDCLEIRNKKPGYMGECFCGDNIENTIVSEINWMALIFFSNIAYSSTGFKANVKFHSDDDNCYLGKGEEYRGTRNYTRRNFECLPWAEVSHCPHNPYRYDDYDDDLINNYCRNPGDGFQPWCYTHTDDCKRDYCDVCNIERCYNVFWDCSERLEKEPSFCSDNPEASRGCRLMCGMCNDETLPPASMVTCNAPQIPHDADPIEPLQSEYRMGDNVTFRCKDSQWIVQTRICLSDGTWSMEGPIGGFVCSRCSDGWIPYGQRCVKWFNEQEDRYTASDICSYYNGSLASIRSDEELLFLKTITPGAQRFWFGIENGLWDDDNSTVTYTKYSYGSGYSCAYMRSSDSLWVGVDCESSDFLGFFCTTPLTNRRTLDDASIHCREYIERNPRLCVDDYDFAYFVCPKSCAYSISVSAESDFSLSDSDIYSATAWPEGPFSLLRTKTGCPSYEFKTGGLKQTTLWANLKDVSDVNDADFINTGIWSWPLYLWTDESEYGFCTMDKQESGTWPKGRYCIFKHGNACPEGFSEGSIQYDDIADPVVEQDSLLPSGSYNTDVRFDFCCRRDALVTEEMNLPNDSPFILFKNSWNCQEVAGMNVTKQWHTILNYKDENQTSIMNVTGDIPSINVWYDRFYQLNYCYYKPHGLVLQEEPTETSIAASCTAPDIPENATQLQPVYGKTDPNNTVIPGKFIEYECKDNHKLVEGDLVRACLWDGVLTGSPPVCMEMSDLTLPHYDVDIIDRRFVVWGGYLYTANNTAMRIPYAGKVVAWEFWSQYNGSAAFFILRPTAYNENEIVGYNYVPETLSGRRTIINITSNEQLDVLPGDIIGVYSPYVPRAGITYTNCDVTESGSIYGNQQRSSFAWNPSDFGAGQTYTFVEDGHCKIFSLKAYIEID